MSIFRGADLQGLQCLVSPERLLVVLVPRVRSAAGPAGPQSAGHRAPASGSRSSPHCIRAFVQFRFLRQGRLCIQAG